MSSPVYLGGVGGYWGIYAASNAFLTDVRDSPGAGLCCSYVAASGNLRY